MTGGGRMAKVAEVLWVAQAVYEGNTREWAEKAWADMGGSEPSDERAEHEIVVSYLAPLLDTFRAEDEARALLEAAEVLGDHRTLPEVDDEPVFAVMQWLRDRAERIGGGA